MRRSTIDNQIKIDFSSCTKNFPWKSKFCHVIETISKKYFTFYEFLSTSNFTEKFKMAILWFECEKIRIKIINKELLDLLQDESVQLTVHKLSTSLPLLPHSILRDIKLYIYDKNFHNCLEISKIFGAKSQTLIVATLQ